MARIVKINQGTVTVLLDNGILKDFPSSNFRFPILRCMEIDAIQSLNNENQYMFAPQDKKEETEDYYPIYVYIMWLIAYLLVVGTAFVHELNTRGGDWTWDSIRRALHTTFQIFFVMRR